MADVDVDDACTRCAAPRRLIAMPGWRGEWRCDCGQANQAQALADVPDPIEARNARQKEYNMMLRATGKKPNRSPGSEWA